MLALDSAATRSFRRGGCAVKSAGKERYGEKKRRKQRERAVSQRRQGLERLWSAIPRYALYAAVMAAIAVAAVWIWSRPSLPPTTMAGHTEELPGGYRSEEHTSELQSLMRTSYVVLCLKQQNT